MTDVLYGLVLAGGRSTRMGEDKGQLQYNGLPQREYVFRLLAPFCSRVFVSCRQEQQVPSHLNPLPDRYQIESPLNGILTAFSLYPDVNWLTVPVDMPLVDHSLLQFLLSQRSKQAVATCFFDSDNQKPEPLLVFWEAKAGPLLLDFFENGGVSPREFLIKFSTHCVQAPDVRYLMNLNTPEEHDRFKNQKHQRG